MCWTAGISCPFESDRTAYKEIGGQHGCGTIRAPKCSRFSLNCSVQRVVFVTPTSSNFCTASRTPVRHCSVYYFGCESGHVQDRVCYLLQWGCDLWAHILNAVEAA